MRDMSRWLVVSLVAAVLGAVIEAQSPQPPSNSLPSVSPDGRRIAFISTRAGNPDLFVINADGTGERPLTQTPEAESKAQWSKDGHRLVYAVGKGEVSELREVDVASATMRVIGSVASRGIAVSPSGAMVAYTSGTWQASRLALARIDGSGERMLTTSEQTPIAWNPAFSPDEQWLAFTGQDANRNLQVFLVSVVNGELRALTQVTAAQGRAQVPSFSADGTRVAYQLNRKGASDLWLVHRDARQAPVPAVLANGQELNETPAWFPDGRALAFQSNRTGAMEIWVAGLDGASPRQLTGVGARR